MAQIKVIKRFRDITNYAVVYNAGDMITIKDEERVRNIVARGLGEVVKPVKEEKTEQAEPTANVEVKESEQVKDTATLNPQENPNPKKPAKGGKRSSKKSK